MADLQKGEFNEKGLRNFLKAKEFSYTMIEF